MPPLIPNALNPNAQYDGLGSGDFARCLGHEGGAPHDEVSVLIKETRESALTLSASEDAVYKSATPKRALS